LPSTEARRPGITTSALSLHLGSGCHAIAGASADVATPYLVLALVAGVVSPRAGKVTVMGRLAGSPEVVADVAFVPRHLVLPDGLTVAGLAGLDARVRGRAPMAAADRLRPLGLERLASRRVGELSPAERRSVGLALALTSGAKVLLLEEPFLDVLPEVAVAVAGEVRAFAAVPGKVVVVATASRRDAASLGAALYVLSAERLVPAPSSTDARGAVLRVVLADPMRLAAVLTTEGSALSVTATEGAVEIVTNDLRAAADTVARAAAAEPLGVVSMNVVSGEVVPTEAFGAALRRASMGPPPLAPEAT
jgi:ABC-type multidrug transport system ATPase subunit